MNVLYIVLIVIAALVIGVLILAARKPDTFTVQRTARLPAPAEAIFPLIDDLRRHESWSPFDRPDPATTKSYSGAARGTCAVYEWHGGKAGAGRIEIAESRPASHIQMLLQMRKPMRTDNVVTFTLAPVQDGTDVTWAMQGGVPFPAKILHVFLDMDRMIGTQFERGLSELGTLAARR